MFSGNCSTGKISGMCSNTTGCGCGHCMGSETSSLLKHEDVVYPIEHVTFGAVKQPKPKQPDKWKKKYKMSVPQWQR